MLDIFKKNHEEQPTEQQQIPEAPPQVEQIPSPEPQITEELHVENPQPEETQKKVEDNLPVTLETLKVEETELLDQKSQLLNIEERLRRKTLEEIEKTRERINGLRTEIPELKQKCEKFAKALEIPVYNTSSD